LLDVDGSRCSDGQLREVLPVESEDSLTESLLFRHSTTERIIRSRSKLPALRELLEHFLALKESLNRVEEINVFLAQSINVDLEIVR